MQKILVVEDDTYISGMLCELLSQNGYAPTAAYSGTEGVLQFERDKYSLVLLDLMLPGKSGDAVLSDIRAVSDVPVVAVTAVVDKASTVALLKSGADDYIAKPFDNEELLARIEVQLRSKRHLGANNVTFKDIVLEPEQFDAFISGKAAVLSKREFEILKLLMSNPKKVFTKNNLYESVWLDEFFGDDNTINVHISKLRAKLAALNPDEEYIQTVWGIGFKMSEV
jgi:DNA-binding response OmpR family regulator